MLTRTGVACLVACAGMVASTDAAAESVKGKVRISVQGTIVTVKDEIRSNASNIAEFRDQIGRLQTLSDERADRSEERAATIDDGVAYGIQGDVGVAGWKWGELVIEANYNRFDSTVSDLEVSVRSSYTTEADPLTPVAQDRRFETYPTEVGDISWDHFQLGASLRFRPTKPLNPYVGFGTGRYLVEFQRSRELDELSENISNSEGLFTKYDEKFREIKQVERRLRGIEVEAPDASEWHLVSGLEYTFKRRWTLFLDARYQWTDGRVRITTDGREDFGTSIPNGQVDFLVPASSYSVLVPPGRGGILDTGSAKPDTMFPGVFSVGPRDGRPDPGQAYILGGRIKYGGYHFSTGVRFTF